MQLAAGSHLGDFEIIAPLGAGGMGEVYRARDPQLRREVAIKVLPESWSTDPERLRRFEIEAQATAALNHPNIISIFHVGRHEGSPYIVTELLQGETLRERLRRGPMRLQEACDCAIGIALGLAAAHEAGVIHRDLKPENLFLIKNGTVKILDFGLARVVETRPIDSEGTTATIHWKTEPGHISGTIGYMAPEQVRGLPADPRSDIFAHGLVFYEILTGQRAFRKASSAETLNAILNDDPLPLTASLPDVPPALQRILSRCLEKKPERRFQNASDLAFALDALSDTTGTVRAPSSKARPRWRWMLTIGSAALVLIAASIVWWKQPDAVPVVEAVNQLTSDGETKANSGRLVTDGTRIYFGEGTLGSYKIMEVAAAGGPPSVINTRLPNFQFTALSHDGSYLLGAAGDAFQLPSWAVPLPSGEPRLLGSLEAQDSELFPDGRIVFCSGHDITVAEKDGSNPHKLITIDGIPVEPSVSPDGQRIVFVVWSEAHRSISIDEVSADGSNLRTLVANDAGRVSSPVWSADGRFVIFVKRNEGRSDLWAMPMHSGFLRRSAAPIQLTNGPLSYRSPASSRDGKQIFAVGIGPRGELVRYDTASKQFLPLLAGVHAFAPSWSTDGRWVAYTTYPLHSLWRSRSDGTEALQLTFPPGEVYSPSISPDGKQVAYVNSSGAICLVDSTGGSPPTILRKDASWPQWSLDGTHLMYRDRAASPLIHILELQNGNDTVVPESADRWNPVWVGTDRIVASSHDATKLLMFDVITRKWSDLVTFTAPGYVVDWARTPDNKYLDYVTGGSAQELFRVRLGDGKIEPITSLKTLRRATGPGGNTVISVAPDGSVVFSRDIGTQEIFALSVKWP